ncbi:hypothetical protein D3C81_1839960 [compost metagenome]
MGMAVDDGLHRLPAQLLADQLVGRLGGGRRGQRVDDDPAGLALDEGDVGQIEATHLVDTVTDLVQTVLEVEQRLSLQARVDGFERLAGIEELVAAQLPGNGAVVVLDHQVFRALDQAFLDTIKVGAIAERKACLDLLLGLDGEG